MFCMVVLPLAEHEVRCSFEIPSQRLLFSFTITSLEILMTPLVNLLKDTLKYSRKEILCSSERTISSGNVNGIF
jgi:hypothetical protein